MHSSYHEKDTPASSSSPAATRTGSSDDATALLGEKSPGVQRIEVITRYISFRNRVSIFLGVFLVAYAYGLDGTLRYAYQVCFVLLFELWCTVTVVNGSRVDGC